MAERIFDIDKTSGVIETFSQVNGKNIIRKHQNTDKIIQANMQDLKRHTSKGWKGDMHKVASIPLIVVEQWREELKASHAQCCNPLSETNRSFLKRKLNQAAWSKLRTKEGRV